jgi:hypothetical protein
MPALRPLAPDDANADDEAEADDAPAATTAG